MSVRDAATRQRIYSQQPATSDKTVVRRADEQPGCRTKCKQIMLLLKKIQIYTNQKSKNFIPML